MAFKVSLEIAIYLFRCPHFSLSRRRNNGLRLEINYGRRKMGTRATKAVAVASVRLLPRCNKTKIANYTGIDWTVQMEWSECEITTQKSRQYCWLNGTDNFITCVIANAALNYGMGDTLCASVIKIVINISEKFRHVIKSCSTVKIIFQDILFCVSSDMIRWRRMEVKLLEIWINWFYELN